MAEQALFKRGDVVEALEDYNQELKKGSMGIVTETRDVSSPSHERTQLVSIEVILSSKPYGDNFVSQCYAFRLKKVGHIEFPD